MKRKHPSSFNKGKKVNFRDEISLRRGEFKIPIVFVKKKD
jgi:hypothetical protein